MARRRWRVSLLLTLAMIALYFGFIVPDVLLVDSALGHSAAIDQLYRLRSAADGAKVIVLGIEREDERVVEMIEAGANGYLPKSTTPAELAAAIRTVVRGEAHCSPEILASVVERIMALRHDPPPEPPPRIEEPLTEREAEVLVGIARGLRNKEIGRSLGITVQTVKNHVHSILAKLGVARRRRAVLVGLQLGLLTEDDCEPYDTE
jgi:DNA-binding NarL/FixJ family response regulator